MIRLTRFVVDATENSKEGGVAAEVQLPDWVKNNQKATYCYSYLGHQNESTFVG